MSRLSKKEFDEFVPFLLARDGYICNICKKSIEQLLKEREERVALSGVPYGGRVLIIEHKNNNKNQINGDDGYYAGNIQLACYSCNNYKSYHQDRTQANTPQPTREKLDALRFEPTYNRNLHKYLIENEHICFMELKIGGKNLSEGANEVTCMRYFNALRCTKANPNGRYLVFAYNCQTELCNGTHVCFRGQIPLSLLKSEAREIQKKYINEYALNLTEEERFQWTHKWENINKGTVPPFIEYYQQNSIFIGQFSDPKPEKIIDFLIKNNEL